MKYFKAIFPAALIALLLGDCSKAPQTIEDPRFTDKRVVLQVGDSKLTLGEVQKRFAAGDTTNPKNEFDGKKAFVEQSLDRFLLIEGAKSAGVDGTLDSTLIKRNLLKQLYNEKIINRINVTDGDVEKFFSKYGGELQVGHILLSDSTLAESLYAVLDDGGDFDKLARDFSIDQGSAPKGGSLGYASYGRFDDKFQEVAFKMKIGEISKPLHTRYGWHIIKAFDRIKNTPADFEKDKDKYRSMTHQYMEKTAVGKFVDNVRSKYNYEIVWPTIEFMLHKADSVKAVGSKPAGMPSSGYLDSTQFSPPERQMLMVKYDGGGATVGDFLDLLKGYAPQRAPELRDHIILDQILEGVSLPPLLVKMAINEGIDKSETYQADIAYLQGSNLAQKMTNMIYGSIPEIQEADLKAYYDSHPDDFYMPDQIRVAAISVKTKQEADDLLLRIKAGANFALMAQKYSLDKKSAAEGGDLNFFTVARYTTLYNAGVNLKAGEMGGPVEWEGNWWIFKFIERIVRFHKKIDLVKGDIYSLLGNEWRKKALSDWTDKMKAKIQYQMDLDLIKTTLISGKLDEASMPKGK
jgi:parvulin-like peptidyl-prolyl isomerase